MIIQGNNTTYGKCVNCVQGVISPTLANMTLDGLEDVITKQFGSKGDMKRKKSGIHLIRYADDCVPRI